MNRKIADADQKIFNSMWQMLEWCIMHAPLSDLQMQDATEKVIHFAEERKWKGCSKKFIQGMALAIIDEIEASTNKIKEVMEDGGDQG